MSTYDLIIVGGGLVGLSTAYQCLQRAPSISIAILEKEARVAAHQSGNNSGVIHSGVYYEPGSRKAVNCIQGYSLLLDFCRENAIPLDLCGKLIVAKDASERNTLHEIQKRGKANGLEGLHLLSPEEARSIEPHLSCFEALHVPMAGIINFRSLAEKLAALLEQKGVALLTGNEVRSMKEEGGGVRVMTNAGEYLARHLITCGGLYADKLCRMAGMDPGFMILPFRGEFYRIKGDSEKLVNGLIYPVPDMRYPFLGIHLTSVPGGGLEAGPNAVLAGRREGYRFRDIHITELREALAYRGFWRLASEHWAKGLIEIRRSLSKKAFHEEVARLVPAIKLSDLEYARSGVRAQAVDKKGRLIYDYVIRESAMSTHVCNAPSPAATSCLAIGQYIAEMVLRRTSLT